MQDKLQEVVDLSHQALQQAEQHDWQSALDFQRKRNVLLQEVFCDVNTIDNAKHADALSGHIQQMLLCDEQVKKLVDEQRPLLEEGFKVFHKKRQNIGEYLNHAP